jgi:hypothetical protein
MATATKKGKKSVFNKVSKEEFRSKKPAAKKSGAKKSSAKAAPKTSTAILEVGSEQKKIRITKGMTLAQAFREHAESLGLTRDQVVRFRDSSDRLVDGNVVLEPNEVYSGSIDHEEKG